MLLSEYLRRWSPQQLSLSHLARGHVEDVIATIDMDDFLQLRKTSKHRAKSLNALKYFNVTGYVHEHMRRALWLKLDHSAKEVLDIGTGFGYFPYICEFFGNTAMAIDVPEQVLFDDVTNFLGVKKIHQRIEPFRPLTGLERKFDLVTAFQVAFNRYDMFRPWGEDEWSFFLNDLFSNVLKEGGEIAFELNYDPVQRVWLSEGGRRAMKRYRARIFGASVRLSARR